MKLHKTTLLTIIALFAFLTNIHGFDYNYMGVTFTCKVKNNMVIITSFTRSAQEVTIPATVTDKGVSYSVKEISTFSNGDNYSARKIVIEEGVERIDKWAFMEFRWLKNVSLPSSLKYVGKNAFRINPGMVFDNASRIREVALRNGKEEIIPGLSKDNHIHIYAQNDQPKQQIKETPKEEKKKKEPVVEPKPLKENVKPDIFVSEVDKNIPKNSQVNKHTYCVIIANENYQEAPDVDYALNDGESFHKYCMETLGIPQKQVRVYKNAGTNDTWKAISFMENIQKFDPNARILFYYAGHGFPNEDDKTAYLLPVDGSPKEMRTCVSMREVYDRLGKIKVESVTVLLDACFCGMKRGEDEAIMATRGVAIAAKANQLSGNVVVISAATGKETALAYKAEHHGLFTYHLLDQLKKTKGKASLGELFDEVATEVSKTAVLENDKSQTPTVNTSPAMRLTWKDLHF